MTKKLAGLILLVMLHQNTVDYRNTWKYDQSCLADFLQRFSRRHSFDIKPSILEEAGGKVLGLKICEALAGEYNKISKATTLTVPRWSPLSRHELFDLISVERGRQEDRAKQMGSIIRSSDRNEDWLSAQSGEHKSFRIDNASDLLFIETEDLKASQYVSQKHREGFGLVVDIAFSTLENKSLLRVASGLKRYRGEDIDRPYYTSATLDSEASVKIFNPIDSERVITENVSTARQSYFSAETERLTQDFVSTLYASISKTGVNFSVQLECIVSESDPTDFSLVQIRPSPGCMQFNQEVERPAHSACYKSAVFNKPFSTPLSDCNIVDELDFTHYLDQEHLFDNGSHAIINPKILRGFMRAGATQEAYIWLRTIGYKSIITPYAINPLFKHEMLQPEVKTIDKINSCCGIVLLAREQLVSLVKDLRRLNNPKLSICSDGLISHIYVVGN